MTSTNTAMKNVTVLKTKAPAKRPSTKTAPKAKTSMLHVWLTRVISFVIPCLSVAGTRISGLLAEADHYMIASLVGLVAGSVFVVSLKHVSQSIRAVTRCSTGSSWLLAVAFDLAIVSSELTHSLAPETGLGTLCIGVMVALGALTGALNYLAFQGVRREA